MSEEKMPSWFNMKEAKGPNGEENYSEFDINGINKSAVRIRKRLYDEF